MVVVNAPSSQIVVGLGERSYAVEVRNGAIGGLSTLGSLLPAAEAAAVITDDGVPQAWVDEVASSLADAGLKVELIRFEGGETRKTLATAMSLFERLAELNLHRNDLVVGVGGGLVGDISGFVAACYLRGIAVVHVPTTLLAMVDSSIGGKTGVNLPQGKNLVGTFHQPRAVFADLRTLETLPEHELRCGLAEVVKYGFIADPGILDLLEDGTGDLGSYQRLVRGSVEVKARVVAEDEREAGVRATLNFGHTLGHALEIAGGHSLSHGEAISIGMVFAGALGREIGLIDVVARLRALLDSLGLPTSASGEPRDAIEAAMSRDKKFLGAARFVLLEDLGKATLVTDPPVAAIEAALSEVGM